MEPENPPTPFELLDRGIQEALWRMRWTSLRPIQAEAIEEILGRDRHVIISAETAGGKTEAAFLPILSRIAREEKGSVQALYVGPLRALINDQFRRVEDLCGSIDVPVHRWHSDVSASRKDSLLRSPGGVLLITPESLEALLVNRTANVGPLFSSLRFVVIDELHAFLGNERGLHLASLLARLRRHTAEAFRKVGLSATLGDDEAARRWVDPDAPTDVVMIRGEKGAKEVSIRVHAYAEPPAGKDEGLPAGDDDGDSETEPGEDRRLARLASVARDAVRHFRGVTGLLFSNSRAAAELLADLSNEVLREEKLPETFLVHHGSLSREIREDAEESLKSGDPFTAVCSSTLEMGIDIGDAKLIGQLGAPPSVASLKQRLGRSGRRDGEPRCLRAYVKLRAAGADDLIARLEPELVQTVACIDLLLEGWVEPPLPGALDLSTLSHQVMAVIAERGGASAAALHDTLCARGPFRAIGGDVFARVLRSLGAKDAIEQEPGGDLILGLHGEKLRAGRDFYAVFRTAPSFEVLHDSRSLGTLEWSSVPKEGDALVFGGKRWKVKEVDGERWKIHVVPSTARKEPIFLGSPWPVHDEVRERMRAVLASDGERAYLDEAGARALESARRAARESVAARRRVLPLGEGRSLLMTWAGTRVHQTLAEALRRAGLSVMDRSLALEARASEADVRKAMERIVKEPPGAIDLARGFTPKERRKYDELLSEDLLEESVAREEIEVEGALCVLREMLSP